MFLFDVVNNPVEVLVATGVDSGNREYVQPALRGIDGTGARQPTAVLRAGGLRAGSLRANCRGQIRSYWAGRRLGRTRIVAGINGGDRLALTVRDGLWRRDSDARPNLAWGVVRCYPARASAAAPPYSLTARISRNGESGDLVALKQWSARRRSAGIQRIGTNTFKPSRERVENSENARVDEVRVIRKRETEVASEGRKETLAIATHAARRIRAGKREHHGRIDARIFRVLVNKAASRPEVFLHQRIASVWSHQDWLDGDYRLGVRSRQLRVVVVDVISGSVREGEVRWLGLVNYSRLRSRLECPAQDVLVVVGTEGTTSEPDPRVAVGQANRGQIEFHATAGIGRGGWE